MSRSPRFATLLTGAVLAGAWAAALPHAGGAAPPDAPLDPTFGRGGLVTTDVMDRSDEGVAGVVVGPDGSVTVAGTIVDPGSPAGGDFGLARYRPDGRLDPTFGDGGRVVSDFAATTGHDLASDEATAIAAGLDGTVVVVGRTTGYRQDQDGGSIQSGGMAVARYRADGRLDPAFGHGGLVVAGPGPPDIAFAVVVDPSGRIVVGGGYSAFALTRFLPDGTLDRSFGVDGVARAPFAEREPPSLFSLVLAPDGSLVAGGEVFTLTARRDFAVARFLPDGLVDPTFGGDGTVTTDFGRLAGVAARPGEGSDDTVRALALGPGGTVLAGGDAGYQSSWALARYLPNGALDPTFGDAGQLAVDLGDGYESVYGLVVDGAGRVVAAGSAAPAYTADFVVARYRPDGTPDPSFGDGGYVFTEFGDASNDDATSLAAGPGGRLVVGGRVFRRDSEDFAVAAYRP